MKTVPVSVIIPCYNCCDTIERAALSVVNQTVCPAEVLFINDASTDNTLHRLFDLQKKYGKTWIKVISLPRNQGPGAARNAGWKLSGQPYLAFLDADDTWHPEKVNYQYGWMKKRPDVAVTSHRCIQVASHDSVRDVSQRFVSYSLKPFRLLIWNQMLTRSVMLHRLLPFRFPADKRYSEDYCLWLEMVLNGVNMWHLDIPLAVSFKSSYGEGGLSRDLAAMEKGELDTYKRLWRKNLLPTSLTIGLFGFSLIKHFRRMIIHWATKGKHEL
ncbi:MAG: glycosyltransferase family 2 protein [Pseudomonadota bacterium]